MSPTNIFRMLKIAYPFLVSYRVTFSEKQEVFDLFLEFSDDAPGHLTTFGVVGHESTEEAIAAAIELALIA